ncbi:MAG: FecR domain-containing protein [Lachnospiraceae bacterium]|nr:FecR domain-containing protein [Lachnospiraceae bacterium]
MGFKEFIGTTKGKIAVIGGSAVVAVGIGVAVLLQGGGYRSITVEALTGTVNVAGSRNNGAAYVGEQLEDGDDVTVAEASDLTMCMDGDKYVYADANTHFALSADQSKDASRIKILLDAGSELNELQNALGANDSYEVDTPNSTMSVRGTKFRVTVYTGSDGFKYTLLEVYEGVVDVRLKTENGTYNGVERNFTVGESGLIRGNVTLSEFVTVDKADLAEISGSEEEVLLLHYDSLPEDGVERLIELLKNGEIRSAAGDTSAQNDTQATDDKTDDEQGGATEDHKHTPGEWEVTKEPTCTAAGSRQKLCTECGEVIETEEIAATDHTPGDWTTVKEATCAAEGSRQQKCTVCGAVVKTESIAKTDHTPGEWKTVKNPTCTEAGSKQQTCTKCGAVLATEEIAANGHTPGTWTTTLEPTCEGTGLREQKCSVCGASMNQETIGALGHSHTGMQTITTASCTQAGYAEDRCSRCGAVLGSSSSPQTPHNWVAVYTYQGGPNLPAPVQVFDHYECSYCGARK